MTELFKELLGVYKEKTKLPIVSTYVVLLIVWNWDILSIYLFSSMDMEARICWIKNITTWWEHLLRIIIPLCFAFAYPIISKKLTLINNNFTEATDDNLREQSKTRRVANANIQYLVEAEKNGKKDLETLRVEKEALQNTIDDLTGKLSIANTQNEDLNGKIEASSVLYEAMKSEIDPLINKSNEFDKIIKYLPNYEELIELNKEVLANNDDEIVYEGNVSNLTEKYFLMMNRWDEKKAQFFINIKRGDIIMGKNFEQFSMDEIQQFIKDDILIKNNGMYVVTSFGDNFTRKLGIRKRS